MVFTPEVASQRDFKFDARDHAESCWEAFRDLAPILEQIALKMGKTKETVVIYDPYYCEGSCKKHLAELGFPQVINRNRDFYADLANGESSLVLSLMHTPTHTPSLFLLFIVLLAYSELIENQTRLI